VMNLDRYNKLLDRAMVFMLGKKCPDCNDRIRWYHKGINYCGTCLRKNANKD